VTQGHAVLGAMTEARSVPIVFIYSGDPVGAKIVPNLGRPGGNLTAITLQAVDLARKRIELLKEAAPTMSRLVAFVNPLHRWRADRAVHSGDRESPRPNRSQQATPAATPGTQSATGPVESKSPTFVDAWFSPVAEADGARHCLPGFATDRFRVLQRRQRVARRR